MDGELVKVICAALGPSAACVIVTLYFIRFLSNHMAGNTKALLEVVKTLSGLKAVVDECPERRGR